MKTLHLTTLLAILMSLSSTAQIAIVNDASTYINVKDITHATITEKRQFTILNEKAKEMASKVIFCSPQEKLAKFEGTATDAKGNIVHKFKKNELKRSELSEHFATDEYRMTLDYTPPCYPITINWEWQIDISDGWVTFPSFIPYNFNNRQIKVNHAIYTLTLPQDINCIYKLLNIDSEVKQTIDEKGKKVYTLEVNNVQISNENQYVKPLREQVPMAFFASPHFLYRGEPGSIENWKTFGDWIYTLASKDFKFSPTFEHKIRLMTDTCTSTRSKIEVLYKFLEKTTRYVSIQLGIGGFKPLPVEYTQRTGFGDCKGLSNYLRAMLSVIGIPSYFTIISTENRLLTPDFACEDQCNHAILCIPQKNDSIWVECTNPSLPLGYVHDHIAGHNALLATPEGGKFVTLPQYPDSLNLQYTKININLSPDFLATMTLDQKSLWRQYDDKIPLRYFNEKQFREKLLEAIYAPSATFKSSEITESKEPFAPPSMNIKAELENIHYGNITGNRIFLRANPMHKSFRAIKRNDNRQQDIYVNYGFVDKEEIEIKIPEGYIMENPPEANIINETFGSFIWAILQQGDTIKIVSRFEKKYGQWEASLYNKLYEFEKSIEKYYNTLIVLKKK